MPVQFEEIPSNALVPLFYADVVPAQSPVQEALTVLLIGCQSYSFVGSSAHPADTPYLLSESIVKLQFGNGSMLHWMYRLARANAPFAEIWGVATNQVGGGAARAAGSIQVTTSPAGKTGQIRLLIAGKALSIPVRPSDTSAVLATRIAATINRASADGALLPVIAAVNASDDTLVSITARFFGSSAHDIRISKRHFGQADADLGSLVTVVGLSGGVNDGSLAAVLAALGGKEFDIISYGLVVNSTPLNAFDDYFGPTSGTWSPHQQTYGHAFLAYHGDFSGAVTLVDPRNGPHVTVMGTMVSSSPMWEWSAAIAARAAQHWAAPPEISRPLHGLELVGILPAISSTYWPDRTERQTLLEAGVSTYTIDPDFTVRIERLRTTYKTNVWGDPDGSWRDAVTMFQAQYLVRYLRAAITGAFPRAALTSRESGINGFASPGEIKDVIVHAYKTLEGQGLVENSVLFSQALVVERSATDPNRVDILARADLVNQLRVVAALVETNLQFDPASPVFDAA